MRIPLDYLCINFLLHHQLHLNTLCLLLNLFVDFSFDSFFFISEWVACVHSKFLVLCYLHDVKNVLQLHDLATGRHLKTFPLEVGSIVGYSGQKKDSEIFYQFTSFLSPGGHAFIFITTDFVSLVLLLYVQFLCFVLCDTYYSTTVNNKFCVL